MKRILFLIILFVIDILCCSVGVYAQNKDDNSFTKSEVISVKGGRYDYEIERYYSESIGRSYVNIHDVANYRNKVKIPYTLPGPLYYPMMEDEEPVVVDSWVPYASGWVQYMVCNQDIEKEIIPLVLRCFSKKEREFLKNSRTLIAFNDVFVDSSGKLVEQEIWVGGRTKEFAYDAINPKHLMKIDKKLKKHMTFEDFGMMDIAGLPYLADFVWQFLIKEDGSTQIGLKYFLTWDYVLKDDFMELIKDRVESFRKEFSK